MRGNISKPKVLGAMAAVIMFVGMILLLPTLLFSYLLYLLTSILGMGFSWGQCFAVVMIFMLIKGFKSRGSISARFGSNVNFGQNTRSQRSASPKSFSRNASDDPNEQIIDVEAKVIDSDT